MANLSATRHWFLPLNINSEYNFVPENTPHFEIPLYFHPKKSDNAQYCGILEGPPSKAVRSRPWAPRSRVLNHPGVFWIVLCCGSRARSCSSTWPTQPRSLGWAEHDFAVPVVGVYDIPRARWPPVGRVGLLETRSVLTSCVGEVCWGWKVVWKSEDVEVGWRRRWCTAHAALWYSGWFGSLLCMNQWVN